MNFSQKVKKLFLSQNHYSITFKVLDDMQDKSWKKYFNDLAYMCEAVLMYDPQKPDGIGIISGENSKNIIHVTYDKRYIDPEGIKAFLMQYNFKLKLLKDQAGFKLFSDFYVIFR